MLACDLEDQIKEVVEESLHYLFMGSFPVGGKIRMVFESVIGGGHLVISVNPTLSWFSFDHTKGLERFYTIQTRTEGYEPREWLMKMIKATLMEFKLGGKNNGR